MIWTNEMCRTVDSEMTRGGIRLTWAQEAEILSKRFNEYVHPEQVRGAIRRYKGRSGEKQQQVNRTATHLPSITELPGGLLGHTTTGTATYKDNVPYIAGDPHYGVQFPQPSRIAEQEVLQLDDPNVLIVGDIHAPFHSPEMLDKAVRITQKHFPHIKHCMLIGDLFDFSAISNHVNNQPITSTEADIRAGGKIAKELRSVFELWIGPGNHDERLSKKLNSEFSMTSLLCGALGNTDPGLHITDLDYMYIGEDIIAGHPSSYSSKPTGVASKIALMQRKNIVTGHSHKVGITMSDDGVHWMIDNGHCASDELFYYVRRRMSTFGKMGAGFTIISEGLPFVFGEGITNWKWWM